MVIKTQSLDRAAFFMTFGSELTEIDGLYPNNTFTLEIDKFLLWYEKQGGWVPYGRFCGQRRKVKRKSRKKAGLPEKYVGGKTSGFQIKDIIITPSKPTT